MSTDTHDAATTTTGAGRARRTLDRFVFASLLALAFLVAAPYGSVDAWWEGAFEAAVFALGALWMLEGVLGGGRWLVPEHRLLLPAAALVIFAAAQTRPHAPAREVAGVMVRATLSADAPETWRFALKLAALVLALALLLRYTSGPRRLRALVHAAAGVGFLSAAFGVLRLVGGRDTVAYVSERLAANHNGFAQFINRNHFAFLAELALGAALGLLIHAGRRRRRLPAYAALALVVWTALVLSNSRGGILSMFVALISTALLYASTAGKERDASDSSFDEVRNAGDVRVREDSSRGARRGGRRRAGRARGWRDSWALKGALLASLVAVTLAGVLWVGGERLAERIEALPTDAAAEGPRWGDRRTEIWRAAWRLFLDRPLAGTGLGAFRAAVPAHHDASGEMSLEQAHNDYLELLAGGGLLGAALFAWLARMIVARARRSLRSPDSFRRAAAAGAAGGLLAVAAHSLFDFGLHITANAYVLVMLLAVVCAGARVEGGPRAPSRARAAGEGTDAKTFDARRPTLDGRRRPTFDRRRLFGHLLAAAVMLACVAAALHAFRAGASRLLAETARRLPADPQGADALGVASRALDLNASDPEAHDAHAVALGRRGELEAAARALERAAALRPRYFRQWQRLGRARTLAGDTGGALDAYAEAARLAPFYAEPRWQLGNALLREGRTAEAFAELSRAAESRPALAPYTAELAWRVYEGEASAVAAAVAPRSAQGRAALARFFARRGRDAEALEQYRAGAAEAGDGERRALVSELIAAGKYRAAREVWAGDASPASSTAQGAPAQGIDDGGFEAQSSLSGAGFEWQFARELAAVRFSLDAAAPREGARSLLVAFGGGLDPSARLVSKLFTVEPGARYRLSFAARSEGLVSAGMPFVALLDPAGGRLLAQSEPMPEKTDGWRDYRMEFTTPADGALLVLRRSGCAAQPCPIFGRLWLDVFALQKL